MREPGSHPLTRLREQQNLTQNRLAEVTRISARTIMRAEQNKLIAAESRRRLCEYFALTAEELGLHLPGSLATPEIATDEEEARIDTERENAPTQQPGLQNINTQRRSLLQMGVGATGTLLTPMSDELISTQTNLEVVERFVRALKKPSSVDEIFMSHLEDVTRNNRKRFVLSKNSAHDIRSLYQDVSSHLLTITRVLEHPLPTRTHLCTLAGETTQLLGDICFYEGNNSVANHYYEIAMEAAGEAQNEVLQAVILGRKSFLPMYDGNAKEALLWLQHAHELASRNASDNIRAWLLVVEAEAQAVIGETEACSRALHQSEYLLHRAGTGFSTCAFTAEARYAPLNTQRLSGYMGACYIRLSQPQKAQPILQTYFASMNAASLHRQSITLVDLAKASALEGELEEMYTYASQAIQLLEQTRSARVVQRMVKLRQELHHWQDTASVKQLDQQLAAISTSSVF